MASLRKRKREIQEENIDNFYYLKSICEEKKRKVDLSDSEHRRRQVKKWFGEPVKANHSQDVETTPKSSRVLRSSSSSASPKGLSLGVHAIPSKMATIQDVTGGTPNTINQGNERRNSFKRRNSLQRLKKPLVNLQGSVRAKLTEQLRRRSMRGRQDYSLPVSAETGQLDRFRFFSAEEQKAELPISRQDEYLQQKIDHEIKMRDGTAKLLAASRHPHQMLEAAKNLLTSNTRMIAYMSELQRRKTDQVMKRSRSTEGDQVPCRGKVAVTDIRVPLMWKDSDHFKNKGDHRRYAVFCLLKIDTEIYDSALLTDVDRSMTDLCFNDVMIFNNIGPEFECRFEVYSHKLQDDLSIASTPKKIKKKINEISSNVGRSVGKRLSGLKEDAEFLPNVLLGPKFECIAHGTLTLADVGDCINSHDLVLSTTASEVCKEVPLFGNYCCQMAAQPQCLIHDTTTGPLHVKVSEEWQDFWCRLRGLELSCWAHEDDVALIEPNLSIPVTKASQVSDIPVSQAEREFSFSISTRDEGQVNVYTLAAQNKGDLTRWWDGLQQHFLDQVMWQQACDMEAEFPEAVPQKQSVFMRKGSQKSYVSVSSNSDLDLCIAESDSPMTRILNRLNVDEEQLDRGARQRRSKRCSAPPTSFQQPSKSADYLSKLSSISSSPEGGSDEPRLLKRSTSLETDI